MTDTRNYFMRQAAQAEAFAVATPDPQIKRRFMQIAEEWRRLADPAGRPGPLPKDDVNDVETAPAAINSA
jgi:hypothetical protein